MNDQETRQSPHEGGGSGYLSELIKGVLALPDNELSKEAPPSPQPQTAPQPRDQGDLASLLLSNPALLEKLPALLSMAKPLIGLLGNQAPQQSAAKETAPASAALTAKDGKPASAFDPQKETKPANSHSESDHRAALLCAMKPYLSADRREAIDYIIKLSRLGDLLKSL